MGGDLKGHLQHTALSQFQDRGGASGNIPQKKTDFRQHRFTGVDRRLEFTQPCLGPEVKAIPTVEAGYQRPGIHENPFLHLPNPSRSFLLCDRSAGPSTQPIRSEASARHESGWADASFRNRSNASRITSDRLAPRLSARRASLRSSTSGTFNDTVITVVLSRVLPLRHYSRRRLLRTSRASSRNIRTSSGLD